MDSKDTIKFILNTFSAFDQMHANDVFNATQVMIDSKPKKVTPLIYSCMCGECTSKDQARNKYVCPKCNYVVIDIDPDIGYAIEAEYTLINKESQGENDG